MNNPPPPPGFSPPPFGYGPPPGAPPGPPGMGGMPGMPPPNPMNPMGYGQPPKPNGLAVAALVCGILAIVPGCCCGFFGIPLSIAAVAMGIVSMQQINASMTTPMPQGGKNMAIAGTVCGGIAIALDIVGVIFNVGTQMMNAAGSGHV